MEMGNILQESGLKTKPVLLSNEEQSVSYLFVPFTWRAAKSFTCLVDHERAIYFSSFWFVTRISIRYFVVSMGMIDYITAALMATSPLLT